MKSIQLAIEKIEVLPEIERKESRIEDDLLAKSIAAGGIQQPLIVVPAGRRMLLADGLRRLRIARSAGISPVWCVLHEPPKGEAPEDYILRLRFLIDTHRQDLRPSQKAELIETLKKMFGMNHKQVSAYLGIDADSVTNWLAVRSYIPTVVTALDNGVLTMEAARAFNGMSEMGQRHVWQHHVSDLSDRGGGKLHKQIRGLYPPDKHPEFYRDARVHVERLARPASKRTVKPRPGQAFTKDEKSKLSNSYELKEAELEKLKAEDKQLMREIRAATPIVAAIMRNEKLLAMVPNDMREEFERFAEVYV